MGEQVIGVITHWIIGSMRNMGKMGMEQTMLGEVKGAASVSEDGTVSGTF